MPRVASDDQGGTGGFIRSHTFAAANTALPVLNGYSEQLREARESLQSSASVDIFVVTVNGQSYGPDEIMPSLDPGDEIEVSVVVRNQESWAFTARRDKRLQRNVARVCRKRHIG